MSYARYQNTLDAGTQGATITAANSSGSGSAFTQVFGAGILTYDSTAAIQGSKGALSESASSVAAFNSIFPAAVAAAGFSIEFQMPSLPGSDFHLARLTGASDARLVSIHVSNTNRLRLSDGTGTASGIWAATDALVAGTKYRVEVWAKAGTTSTTAEIRTAYYLAGSTTPIGSFTTTAGSIATGTPFAGFIWGRITTSTIQATFDSPVWETDGTALPGPLTVPLGTPVVTKGTTTNPTTTSSTDGTQVVTWPAVTDAVTYTAWRAAGSSPTQGSFAQVATGVTSPYTFTGLSQGTYSFGIKAMP
jgi:hypothetical protein